MARAAGRAGEHVERRRLDPLPRPEQDGAVEVALHAAVVADLLPAPVERDPPVEPDHVAARVAHLLEQRRRAGAEVDRRAVDRGEDARRVRLHELLVVRRRERADPRVEELDHVRAGAHLAADVARERVGELLHQRVPRRRLGVHHPLHVQELAARLALDQVAGDGERAAAEADHRLVGAQLAAHDRDRLEDERHRLLRLGDGQPLDVGARADRLLDHRADVLDQLDVDAHPEQRQHDVGEHHGRVDVVAAHRLQRHLGAELGLVADLEERVRLADLAVLRQRAARLAHEPDRRALGRLAARGADEEGLAHRRSRLARGMERVGEHPVPAGPLAVRWLGYELPEFRAGAEAIAEVVLAERRHRDLALARRARRQALLPLARRPRQRDRLGRPARRFGAPSRPGDEVEVELRVRAPQPPGRYRLAFDLVEELRFWFAEVGSHAARAGRRGAAADRRAAARRRRPRRRGRARRPRRSRRRRSRSSRRTPSRSRTSSPARSRRPTGRAGSSTRTPRATPPSAARSRRRERALRPWAPGGGRNPAFSHPLLLPSLLAGLEPGEHEGLPAYVPGRRAGDLRRPDQTSTATRSSTRVKTSAPSASETHGGDDEVDHVAGRRRLAEEERIAHRLDRRRQRIAPVDQVDEPGMVAHARDRIERVEHRRQEEPRQQQRGDEVLDVAVDRVQRRDREREPGDEATASAASGSESQTVSRASGR